MRLPMTPTEARCLIESCCQVLVDAGAAQWDAAENGDAELHMESGEIFRFGGLGVTRLERSTNAFHPSTRNEP